MTQPPTQVTVANALTLASAVAHLASAVIGVMMVLYVTLVMGLATLGLGLVCIVCIVFPAVQFVWAIVELVVAVQGFTGTQYSWHPIISGIGAGLAMCCFMTAGIFALLPMLFDIVAAVMMVTPEAKGYLADLEAPRVIDVPT